MTVLMLLSAIPAIAYSYNDNYPAYRVESLSPNGYCYLYDTPGDIKGRNLGRHDNGEIVKVIEYNGGNGFCFVICQNGRTGYIRAKSLTAVADTQGRELYRVYSIEPAGYCYLYDSPSDITGKNMGRFDNGEYFEMIDRNASTRYAKVRSQRTGQYGYFNKEALVPQDQYKPTEMWAMVNSTSPRGYCYQYNKPGDVTGTNLGRHNNGEWVRVIDWDASSKYALVECTNGKIGYIKKASLSR